ncbi:hypothetical protein B0H11DRAFT_2070146 [Mycena galericulata]|nr:hypothetical protein B0H11DRAFT_2070146 [Mycena galericulata]
MPPQSYTMLPTSPDTEPSENVFRPERPAPALAFWASIGAICTSLISIALFIAGSFPGDHHTPHSARNIRRISSYINLDKVERISNHSFPPTTNFSPLLLQIYTSDPLRSLNEDERGYQSIEGDIFPDDRHFVVSSTISTLVHFRHVDYGMERCTLHIIVPDRTMKHDPGTFIGSSSILDVWVLDSASEISRNIPGSWDYAPPRRNMLTTISFLENMPFTSRQFLCRSGEFSTFEFTCSSESPECHVEFWQVKGFPLNGVYMVQHDSIAAHVVEERYEDGKEPVYVS